MFIPDCVFMTDMSCVSFPHVVLFDRTHLDTVIFTPSPILLLSTFCFQTFFFFFFRCQSQKKNKNIVSHLQSPLFHFGAIYQCKTNVSIYNNIPHNMYVMNIYTSTFYIREHFKCPKYIHTFALRPQF